jgi:mono/diheme cytochrome c family protein
MCLKKIPIVLFLCCLCISCMDMACMRQYDISKFWKKLDSERVSAHSPKASLTDAGKLAVIKETPLSDASDTKKVEQNYKSLCASCHGDDGKGKTPLGLALKPGPRDFTDVKWQAQVSDAHLVKVIKEGGASVGLSATMAPWGGVLSDQEIQEMIKKLREFAK